MVYKSLGKVGKKLLNNKVDKSTQVDFFMNRNSADLQSLETKECFSPNHQDWISANSPTENNQEGRNSRNLDKIKYISIENQTKEFNNDLSDLDPEAESSSELYGSESSTNLERKASINDLVMKHKSSSPNGKSRIYKEVGDNIKWSYHSFGKANIVSKTS